MKQPIIHLLWTTDFDAIVEKLKSFGRFIAYMTFVCSVMANKLPDYRKRAGTKLRWANKQFNRAVHFMAFNWCRSIRGKDDHRP